jgi:hypothetical protein
VFVSASARVLQVAVPGTETRAEAEAELDLEACPSWVRSSYWGGRNDGQLPVQSCYR